MKILERIAMGATCILIFTAFFGSVNALADRAKGDSSRDGVMSLDTDRDGYLTHSEYSAGRLSTRINFDAIDADEDGLLSETEIRTYMKENGRRRTDRQTEG